ncbi:MAG: SDR family oxidoreductase [Myxococcota bacterium]
MREIGQFEHTDKISFELWRQILAVNLDGSFLMSRQAIPHRLQTKGVIVNAGSTAGLMGLAYGAAYAASKGAVHALTRAIAVEYSGRGLRCNSVCPAAIETGVASPKLLEGTDMALVMRAASLHGTRPPEVVADRSPS